MALEVVPGDRPVGVSPFDLFDVAVSYPFACSQEIEDQLQDLMGFEHQECGTGQPKHPSLRPSGRELGFETDTPSVEEILEAATIQRGLRSKKLHLMFAKLAKLDPARWSEAVKREAQYNPKIEGGAHQCISSLWLPS